MAQNYLLKIENNLIENPTEEDLEEQKCFNKYYSKILKNSNINNITNNFISEKGYTVEDLLKNDKEDKQASEDKKVKIPHKKIQNELNKLEMELDSLFEKYKKEIDIYSNDKFRFSNERYDPIKTKEERKVLPLKEPNLKEGVPHSRFKYKSFKSEDKI